MEPNLRVILTQDRRLVVTKAMSGLPWLWLSRANPKEQITDILDFFGLTDKCDPALFMSVCVDCNGYPFERRSREEVKGRVPDRVQAHYDEFWECPRCSKVFWEGTVSTLSDNTLLGMIYSKKDGPQPLIRSERLALEAQQHIQSEESQNAGDLIDTYSGP